MLTVQLKHIDRLVIRTPTDVGEIAVCRIASLQIDGFVCLQVIDPHRHLVAGHTCHRVFVGLVGRLAWEDVNLRVVCHHALVHTVESQFGAIRTPEGTFIDTELITMYGLSIHDLPTAIGG